jgi:hypothetical protein
MRQQPDLLFAWDNFFMARSYSFKKKFTQITAATFWDFYLLIHGISIIEQKIHKPVVTTIGFLLDYGNSIRFQLVTFSNSFVIQKH